MDTHDFDHQKALVASLVGRTIIAATFDDAAPDEDWTGHEYCDLVLDDGREIGFTGWGHDAWGINVIDAAEFAIECAEHEQLMAEWRAFATTDERKREYNAMWRLMPILMHQFSR